MLLAVTEPQPGAAQFHAGTAGQLHHFITLHNTGCKTQEDFGELDLTLKKKIIKKARLQRAFVGDRIKHCGEEDA